MLTVIVRFERPDVQQSFRLEGVTKTYPAIGKTFVFQVGNTQVTFGKVVNIRSYRNVLLVQTEEIVAEVWIMTGDPEDWSGVVPFTKPLRMEQKQEVGWEPLRQSNSINFNI